MTSGQSWRGMHRKNLVHFLFFPFSPLYRDSTLHCSLITITLLLDSLPTFITLLGNLVTQSRVVGCVCNFESRVLYWRESWSLPDRIVKKRTSELTRSLSEVSDRSDLDPYFTTSFYRCHNLGTTEPKSKSARHIGHGGIQEREVLGINTLLAACTAVKSGEWTLEKVKEKGKKKSTEPGKNPYWGHSQQLPL